VNLKIENDLDCVKIQEILTELRKKQVSRGSNTLLKYNYTYLWLIDALRRANTVRPISDIASECQNDSSDIALCTGSLCSPVDPTDKINKKTGSIN
jgi:hypothetical protein